MAIKFSVFSEMLDHYLSSWNHSYEFIREFSKIIRMADYLDDVSPEAHKINKAVEKYRDLGYLKL